LFEVFTKRGKASDSNSLHMLVNTSL
jgi:hypothetical protein